MSLLNRSLTLFAVLFCSATASAHVTLIAPNGGETLHAGDTFNISWSILIAHGQQNWDLTYSTTGAGGPWIPIATDLPPGSTAAGSVHNYLWTVPDTPSQNVRVRVKMDNLGTDYYDKSAQDLTIVGTPATDCNANGILDTTELATGIASDFDGDGQIDTCELLSADISGVSIGAGGAQALSVHAGLAHGGDLYMIAGSVSGSSPGTPFGALMVPLNFDAYTQFTLTNANTPPLVGTFGALDPSGNAAAQLVVGAGTLDPGLVGLTVEHAGVILGTSSGVDAATNWMPLTLSI